MSRSKKLYDASVEKCAFIRHAQLEGRIPGKSDHTMARVCDVVRRTGTSGKNSEVYSRITGPFFLIPSGKPLRREAISLFRLFLRRFGVFVFFDRLSAELDRCHFRLRLQADS